MVDDSTTLTPTSLVTDRRDAAAGQARPEVTAGDVALAFRVIRDATGSAAAATKRLRLMGRRHTIGSDPACDVRLVDDAVRPRHASLSSDGVSVTVEGQGGDVEVNGRSVTTAVMVSGDVLRLGRHRFEFLSVVAVPTANRPASEPADEPEDDNVWRAKLRAEIDQWRSRREELDGRSGELDGREDSIRARESGLKRREDDLRRRRDAVEESRRSFDDEHDGYRRRLEEAVDQLEQSRRRAEEATAAVARITERFEVVNRQVAEFDAQRDQFRQEEMRWAAEARLSEKERAGLASRVTEAQEAREQALADAEQSRRRWEEEAGEARREAERQSERADEADRRVEAIRRELEESRGDGDEELRSAHSELESLREQVDDIRRQGIVREAALREEVDSHDDTIATLRTEAQRLRETIESTRENSESLQRRCDAAEARVQELESAGPADSEDRGGSADAEETRQLRDAMDHLSLELSRANEELARLRDENERFAADLEQLRQERDDATRRLDEAVPMDRYEAVRRELDDVRAELRRHLDGDAPRDGEVDRAGSALAGAEDDHPATEDVTVRSGPDAWEVTEPSEAGGEAASEVPSPNVEASTGAADTAPSGGPSDGSSPPVWPGDEASSDGEPVWPTYEPTAVADGPVTIEPTAFIGAEADRGSDAENVDGPLMTTSSPDVSSGHEDRPSEASDPWGAFTSSAEGDPDPSDPVATEEAWATPSQEATESFGEWRSPEGASGGWDSGAGEEREAADSSWEDRSGEATVSAPAAWSPAFSSPAASSSSAWGDGEPQAAPESVDVSDDAGQEPSIAPEHHTSDDPPTPVAGSLADQLLADLRDEPSDDLRDVEEPQAILSTASDPAEDIDDFVEVTYQPTAAYDFEAAEPSDLEDGSHDALSPDGAAEGYQPTWPSESGGWDDESAEPTAMSPAIEVTPGPEATAGQLGVLGAFESEAAAEYEEEAATPDHGRQAEAGGGSPSDIGDASPSPGSSDPSPPAGFSDADDPSAEPDEDSIEAYMNRLLGRVGGGASPQPEEPISMSSVAREVPADQSPETDSTPLPVSAVDDGPIVPRSHAPEKNSDLSAMRQLANESARSAIDASTQKQAKAVRQQAIFHFASAGVCLMIGAAANLFISSTMLWIVAWVMAVVASAISIRQGLQLWKESK